MSVRFIAPAKINLTLRVAPPRADGLHPIESVVAFASDVGDYIETAPSEQLSLEIVGRFAPDLSAGEDNLVLRAARALASAAGMPARAAIRLEKNLPVASGIGGGSADAAATLRSLCDLWRLGWSEAQLATIGANLGADVPVFFSTGAAAYMTGVGEICARIETPVFPAVLVNPGAPLATPDVYRRFDAMRLGSPLAATPAPHWRSAAQAIAEISSVGNDLFAPACTLLPVLQDVLAELEGAQGVLHAGLSGSGATMFALCNDLDAAAALAFDLQVKRPRWWVTQARLGGA